MAGCQHPGAATSSSPFSAPAPRTGLCAFRCLPETKQLRRNCAISAWSCCIACKCARAASGLLLHVTYSCMYTGSCESSVVTDRHCVRLALYCICVQGVCDAGSDLPQQYSKAGQSSQSTRQPHGMVALRATVLPLQQPSPVGPCGEAVQRPPEQSTFCIRNHGSPALPTIAGT
jgi:hypothetical protein